MLHPRGHHPCCEWVQQPDSLGWRSGPGCAGSGLSRGTRELSGNHTFQKTGPTGKAGATGSREHSGFKKQEADSPFFQAGGRLAEGCLLASHLPGTQRSGCGLGCARASGEAALSRPGQLPSSPPGPDFAGGEGSAGTVGLALLSLPLQTSPRSALVVQGLGCQALSDGALARHGPSLLSRSWLTAPPLSTAHRVACQVPPKGPAQNCFLVFN